MVMCKTKMCREWMGRGKSRDEGKGEEIEAWKARKVVVSLCNRV